MDWCLIVRRDVTFQNLGTVVIGIAQDLRDVLFPDVNSTFMPWRLCLAEKFAYPGHMSSNAMTGIPDAASDWTPRQLDRVNKVLDAAAELLRESSYSELTMRDVAARAGVSPATAYNYFSSKNALIAEVYLRFVRSVPLFVDVNQSVQTRITQQLHELAVVVADEPELAAAATTALMDDAEEVRHQREKIGWEVRRRITAALGPGDQSVVLTALELFFYGALVRAATSSLTYHQIADQLNDVIALLFAGVGER